MADRIQLNDSMETIVAKMAGGNPGAINICCKLIKENADIDHDSVLDLSRRYSV